MAFRSLLGVLLVWIAWVVPLSSASSQSVDVDRDARVRIKALLLGAEPLAGTVSDIDTAGLTFIPESSEQPIAIAFNEITSLELSRGRPSRLWWGALTGAVIFGTVGARAARDEATGATPYDEIAPLIGAAVLAVPGAVIGGVIGAFIHGDERWEPVGARSLRLGVSTGHRARPGLSVSISF